MKIEGKLIRILTKTGVVLCQGYEGLQNAHPHFPGPQQLDGHSGMPGIPSPLLAAQSADDETFSQPEIVPYITIMRKLYLKKYLL